MKRYICTGCRLIKRASSPKTVLCRRCANKIEPGAGNRPNRKS